MDKTELGQIADPIMPETISNDMMAENHLGGRNLNRMSYDSAFSSLLKILKMGFQTLSDSPNTIKTVKKCHGSANTLSKNVFDMGDSISEQGEVFGTSPRAQKHQNSCPKFRF